MKKTGICFLIFLALTLLAGFMAKGDISQSDLAASVVTAVISGLITSSFGISWILQKIFKNKSAYAMFAVADLICIGIVLIIAFSDILSGGSGELSGMFGALLIALIIPLQVIILIGDLILWAIVKIKNKI